MMKRLTRMLALLLAMCLTSGVALADAVLLPEPEKDAYRSLHWKAVTEDAVYLVTQLTGNSQLWRWTQDMPQAEPIKSNLINANYIDVNDGTHKPLSALLTGDDGKLYGFDHLSSTLYTIRLTEDGVAYEDALWLTTVAPMLYDADNLQTYSTPMDATVTNGKLVWLTSAGDVLVYDMETGVGKRCILDGVNAMCGYRDGKVLLMQQKYRGPAAKVKVSLYAFDPVTDEVTLMGWREVEERWKGVAYHKGWDMVVYQDGTRIMGWQLGSGKLPEQLGFIPDTRQMRHTLLGDTLIWSDYETALARDLRRGFTTEHHLALLEGAQSDIPAAFMADHPDVPWYLESKNDLDGDWLDVLQNEDLAIDLVKLTITPTANDFRQLTEAGALLDLSGSEAVKAYVDDLYPAFREAVTVDGGIYGVPVLALGNSGWFVNRKVMEEMGLTIEDIPTSLTELCAFASRWSSEWVNTYPQYTLLDDTEDYRERFLLVAVDMWNNLCQKEGRQTDFDDPVFREAIAAIDGLDIQALNDNLQITDPEQSDYKQCLIWTDQRDVGNWGSYMEETSHRIFLPMTLTPGTPYVAAVTELTVWAVNASCKEAALAEEFLADCIAEMTGAPAYTLLSTMTELTKIEWVAEAIADLNAQIGELTAQRDQSVNPEAVDTQISALQLEIDLLSQPGQLYSFAPSTLQNYIEVVMPAMVIPRAIQPAKAVVDDYLVGRTDADAFIYALNALVQ